MCDPEADQEEAFQHYGVTFVTQDQVKDMDAVVLAVAHDQFKSLSDQDLDKFYGERTTQPVFLDLKGILDRRQLEAKGFRYWSL